MDDAELTYREHEKIGFPAISENDQANILIWHDVEIINRLTPNFKADFIPREVARKYITLSKFRFREFFVKSGYVEKLYGTHLKFPKSDGQWVERQKNQNMN